LEQNYSGPLLPSSSSQLAQYQLDRRHGFFGYPKTESYCCFEMTRHVTKTRRAELKTLYLDEHHKYISRPLCSVYVYSKSIMNDLFQFSRSAGAS
jgi:hypothetical protein